VNSTARYDTHTIIPKCAQPLLLGAMFSNLATLKRPMRFIPIERKYQTGSRRHRRVKPNPFIGG